MNNARQPTPLSYDDILQAALVTPDYQLPPAVQKLSDDPSEQNSCVTRSRRYRSDTLCITPSASSWTASISCHTVIISGSIAGGYTRSAPKLGHLWSKLASPTTSKCPPQSKPARSLIQMDRPSPICTNIGSTSSDMRAGQDVSPIPTYRTTSALLA